jgi:hypothetical protein
MLLLWGDIKENAIGNSQGMQKAKKTHEVHGHGFKVCVEDLKEAPISENAPFQSQRHTTKFTIIWDKKIIKPTLMEY